MAKRKPLFTETPVEQQTPMILRVPKSLLLQVINEERVRARQTPLPVNQVEVTVRCPGGGDWSSSDIELNDDEQAIEIRWRQ